MTVEEAIEVLVNYIKTHHGARENGKAIVCEALNTICGALEDAKKYKWHDLRKNPSDLPKEHDSIFARFKDTNKWHDAMYEKVSEDVLVCFEFEDGSRIVKQSSLKDGKYQYDVFRKYVGKAIAWRYIEPFYEGENE